MVGSLIRCLGRLVRRGNAADHQQGIGQSLFDDLRFRKRFRDRRRTAAIWRDPIPAERAAIAAHPILQRFAIWVFAVTEVDGEHWVACERDWFGYPDPPRYAFFALSGETIRVAVDFWDWPNGWTLPAPINQS